jgi:hypothetical protein
VCSSDLIGAEKPETTGGLDFKAKGIHRPDRLEGLGGIFYFDGQLSHEAIYTRPLARDARWNI